MLGMHPFVRFLNQNRRKIRILIVSIIMFFLILGFLNKLAEKKVQKQNIKANEQYVEILNSKKYKQLINRFIEFCINGDEDNAYILLSSENKQEKFKTLNEFKTNYISKYFSTNKNYTITYYLNNDGNYYYSVKIFEDILSTGKADNNPTIQTFIVLQENEEDKIKIDI